MARLAALLALSVIATSSRAFKLIVTPVSLPIKSTDTTLPQAEFAVNLTAKVPKSAHKKALLRGLRGVASKTPTATLAGSDQDEEYLTDIIVGGQKFKVIVDTGSWVFSVSDMVRAEHGCRSDTWFAAQNFSCFDLSDQPQPTSSCAFGSSGFNPSASKTYVAYPEKNFNISYGDNEFLNGWALSLYVPS